MTPNLHAPASIASPSRSAAQRAASRANGAKGRGPTSLEGKRRSRRNAAKHGLSGAGAALPDALAGALTAEVAAFADDLQPTSAVERALVEQAALGALRLRRLAQADDHDTRRRVRHALEDWDAARDAEITTLAGQLERGPLGTAELGTRAVLEALGRTAEGCDWLADAWDGLLTALEERGHWGPREATRAACLLGRRASGPRPEDDADWRAFWSDVAACRGGGDETDARARLRGIAEDRMAALIERGDGLWQTQDGPDRAEAPERALFDASPEGRLRARYLNDAARLQFRALAELRRLRRGAAGSAAAGSRGPGFEASRPSDPGGLAASGPGAEGLEASGPGSPGDPAEPVEGSREEPAPEASGVEPAPAPEPVSPAPPAPAPTPPVPRETNPAPRPPERSNRPDDTQDGVAEAALASRIPAPTPRWYP
jgi:hypothetical protein